jgi:hypothetical protein
LAISLETGSRIEEIYYLYLFRPFWNESEYFNALDDLPPRRLLFANPPFSSRKRHIWRAIDLFLRGWSIVLLIPQYQSDQECPLALFPREIFKRVEYNGNLKFAGE